MAVFQLLLQEGVGEGGQVRLGQGVGGQGWWLGWPGQGVGGQGVEVRGFVGWSGGSWGGGRV